MRKTNRILVVVATLALLTFGLAIPAQAGAEGSFVSKINSSRASQGLPPLQVYSDLVDDARSWSTSMMNAGGISHNPNLASVTSGWEALGENVGVGPTVDVLHTAFMNSAGHRQNIMGDFTHVGVGVVQANENQMWVTVIFMRKIGAAAPATTTTTTQPPAATTTTTNAPASQPKAPATPAPAPVPSAASSISDEDVIEFEAYGRPPGLQMVTA